jgi:hypothetical protein
MTGPGEEEIRTRAHQLWQAAGEPHGSMDAFWYEAERELLKKSAKNSEVPPGMTDNLLA